MTRPVCTCASRACRPCVLVAGRDDYARLWEVSDEERVAARERVNRLGEWVVPPVPAPAGGPGTELKKLLASVGLDPANCSCNSRAAEMDRMGVAWCRENREQLASHLRAEAAQRAWREKVKAGAMAVSSGLAFRLDPTDLFGSLVDEAIRRAVSHSGGNLSHE